MKKKLFLMLTLTLVLSNACGENSTNTNTSTITSVSDAYQPYGQFYDLEEAYNTGLISDNDLYNICYYNNLKRIFKTDENGFEEEVGADQELINPIDVLDITIEDEIISDFYQIEKNNEVFILGGYKKEDVRIGIYCGKYNDFYAVRIADFYGQLCVEGRQIIGDYTFIFPYEGGYRVLLWKANV